MSIQVLFGTNCKHQVWVAGATLKDNFTSSCIEKGMKTISKLNVESHDVNFSVFSHNFLQDPSPAPTGDEVAPSYNHTYFPVSKHSEVVGDCNILNTRRGNVKH